MLCLCFTVLSSVVQAAEKFFSVLYDVPILAGLELLPELSYSYDKESGNIAYAAALIEKGNPASIYMAYKHSLPQFGWNNIGENSYYREGEVLDITHEPFGQSWVFHFTLHPK